MGGCGPVGRVRDLGKIFHCYRMSPPWSVGCSFRTRVKRVKLVTGFSNGCGGMIWRVAEIFSFKLQYEQNDKNNVLPQGALISSSSLSLSSLSHSPGSSPPSLRRPRRPETRPTSLCISYTLRTKLIDSTFLRRVCI